MEINNDKINISKDCKPCQIHEAWPGPQFSTTRGPSTEVKVEESVDMRCPLVKLIDKYSIHINSWNGAQVIILMEV